MRVPAKSDEGPLKSKAAGLGSMGGFDSDINYRVDDEGNSAAAQRARTLAALRLRPHTTLELRRLQDVLHPAGRVMELRKLGETIQTLWTTDVTSEGNAHRVARYLLISRVQA